jgi:hypothetical protein
MAGRYKIIEWPRGKDELGSKPRGIKCSRGAVLAV